MIWRKRKLIGIEGTSQRVQVLRSLYTDPRLGQLSLGETPAASLLRETPEERASCDDSTPAT
ncbi:MAG: hypothetical protein ACE5IY_08305 [bacterium]